ncbi:unnamed protein product [Lasius platythorax]|uniref:Uncharacterized protein n=1 Tax=Lasius platythorax TaxID=488582 RepID=A0AAV2NT43_9HYME
MCVSLEQPLHPPTPDLGFRAEEEPSSTHASQVPASTSCDTSYNDEEWSSEVRMFPGIMTFLRDSSSLILYYIKLDGISRAKSSAFNIASRYLLSLAVSPHNYDTRDQLKDQRFQQPTTMVTGEI